MENYPLHRNKTQGTLLTPSNSMYSNEYADNFCDLHLRKELINDSNSKYKSYYRLRAKNYHTIEEALAYNIKCPKWSNGKLKQIGRCIDSRQLGLYTCAECNKNK